jgi:nitrous oxidase accessory protein
MDVRRETAWAGLRARLLADPLWTACAAIAAALILIAAFLPLWEMTLKAPQYPEGLHLQAYGWKMEGRIREINALNHYVGVKPIEPDNVLELKLFAPGVAMVLGALVLATAVRAWRGIRLRWVAVGLVWTIPVFMLIDMQYWLYTYGHDLNPKAALRLEEFTPRVIGDTVVLNFHTTTMVSTGFWLLIAAGLIVSVGPEVARWLRATWANTGEPATKATAIAGLLVGAMFIGTGVLEDNPEVVSQQGGSLQVIIDAAAPGDMVMVPAGLYEGPVVIDKTLTLVGDGLPVIDGGRAGDVVRITADGVTLRGFVIQGSGRNFSTEPAGIRLEGENATIEGNQVRDVLYGLVLQNSGGHTVRGNRVQSIVENPPERRGHAIYLWNTNNNTIEANVLSDAKDGIFLGFSSFNHIADNQVSRVRYGIHYMYADDNWFTGNYFTNSIAGAAIMYSRRLELRDNEFAHNTSSASGYGILLKDVDDLTIVGNLIHGNRLGMTMEGAPLNPNSFVRIEGNLIGYNQTALEMTTTTNAVIVGNTFVGNLNQVASRGSDLKLHNTWAEDGRGNYWDAYQGYDADGDGVGDLPFRYEGAYADLLERNEALKAFQYTFAQATLDLTAKWFPVYRPQPKVIDPSPLMSPTMSLPRDGGAAAVIESLAMAGGLLAVALGIAWASRSTFRRGWSAC